MGLTIGVEFQEELGFFLFTNNPTTLSIVKIART
jgi:hypothetical protein